MGASYRPSFVEIDAGAIAHNAALLRRVVAPARLCAVVKADGYGHGAVTAALAALRGGAQVLAVALVEEAVVLRDAAITAPILVLSEPPSEAMGDVVAYGLTPTVYSTSAIGALRRAVRAKGPTAPLGVHVKLDTGMHRVGCDDEDLDELVEEIVGASELVLEALWTHFAVAEDLADPFTALQLERFTAARRRVEARTSALVCHVANSAGALGHAEARFDLVRCGIALYGYLPSPALASTLGGGDDDVLRPAMSLKSRVHALRTLEAGERPSYGRIRPLLSASRVASVPLGYADGVWRELGEAGADVLIGGVRRPLAGRVTMDQVLVDCGTDERVREGDEVVFLGRQGNEVITADEWASRLRTISYEVLCRIGPRVPRVVVGANDKKEQVARGATIAR